jgi:diguanylate cyclase (GGDEF)-like protein
LAGPGIPSLLAHANYILNNSIYQKYFGFRKARYGNIIEKGTKKERENKMPKNLAKRILADKSEILSSWLKHVKTFGGSYAQVSSSELLSTLGDFLDAFCETLAKGNFLNLRMWLDKTSRLRSSQGFRISEIQRCVYSLYYVLKPFLDQLEKKGEFSREASERVNSILIDILFELSEAYHKRLNERVEGYIEKIENINLKLKETSIRDELTGCYNHRYFHDVLSSELSRTTRYKRPLSIAMFDIDHFKKFNDTYGHPFGDKVLKEIGGILMKSVRGSDTVFRYGGEEFVIILPETKKEKAFIIVERLRKQISVSSFKINAKKTKVTVSGGIDGFDDNPIDKDTLISNTDKALYLAKRRGRNQVALFGQKK